LLQGVGLSGVAVLAGKEGAEGQSHGVWRRGQLDEAIQGGGGGFGLVRAELEKGTLEESILAGRMAGDGVVEGLEGFVGATEFHLGDAEVVPKSRVVGSELQGLLVVGAGVVKTVESH
jgi:hypothetical protein